MVTNYSNILLHIGKFQRALKNSDPKKEEKFCNCELLEVNKTYGNHFIIYTLSEHVVYLKLIYYIYCKKPVQREICIPLQSLKVNSLKTGNWNKFDFHNIVGKYIKYRVNFYFKKLFVTSW